MTPGEDPARRNDDPTLVLLGRTRTLCEDCLDTVGVDGSAVAVFAGDTTRDLVYATDSTAERIDELQFTLGEGPCLAAYRSHRPEIHSDVADPAVSTQWPVFVPELIALGVRGIYALPLGPWNGGSVGVLELYCAEPRSLDVAQCGAAEDCAAILGPTVLEELDPTRYPSTWTDPALFPHGNVHVAAGMMAGQLRISPADAVSRLRAMAFAEERRITALAEDIIAARRTFSPDEFGNGAR
ncbi:GAF and ANTAR domain-containing protein [Rhodococcus tibetensis]|uniref:GAF and ANTAR domain-containing protein n=1 Tax=Rhodococcus tibetensis TaxID=2965064 RepID=A0ABT1QJW7_9NOCA|nr:GAF and ANTAR domain-containing protein [Rhodococcus sp. FXJ9.536]MCQ4122568.1 GAF and ANTAR domain-containing protein [Rhodococcus sp. FXJ9.536]